MPLRPTSDPRRSPREDFVRSQLTDGSLRLPDGQRAAVLPKIFFQLLAAELEPAVGDSSRHVLYKFGYEWALRDMVRLSHQLDEEFGGGANLDLWQMDAKFVLDRWWAPLAAAGWGTCAFDLSSLTRGFGFAEVGQSIFVTPAGSANQPTCHLYAGLFAGAFSFVDRIERHAVEFQCVSLGAPTCRFVVGPGPQVDEVESWRIQRISAEEIRRRLA